MKNKQYTAQNYKTLSLKTKKKMRKVRKNSTVNGSKYEEVRITTSNIVNSAVNALNSIHTRAGNLGS